MNDVEATNTAVADEVESARMSFGEHLEELRFRLIKSLVAWLVCFIVAICFYDKLVEFICWPHFRAMKWLGIPEEASRLQSGGYAKPIFAVMKLSFIIATAAASPVWIWQIWAFISAGLYKHERKYVYRYAAPSFLLFLGGCVFGYLVLVPVGLYGMASMLNLKQVLLQFMFQDYLDLVMTLTVITGAIFELPLVMMFLTSIGLVEPKMWWKWSRYAIVAIFLAAAILTPSPDVFTQVLMAAPLTVLYFMGLGLSWFVWRRPAATAPAKPA
jgi:Tat protein translocase TatC